MSAKIPMESSLAISVQSLETAWALSDRNNVSGTCVVYEGWCGLLDAFKYQCACCGSVCMCVRRQGRA